MFLSQMLDLLCNFQPVAGPEDHARGAILLPLLRLGLYRALTAMATPVAGFGRCCF